MYCKKRLIAAATILSFVLSGACIAHAEVLSGKELNAMLRGKTADFGPEGTSSYETDGKYEFRAKSDSQRVRGNWSVQGNRVCVDFDAGGSRCDQYLKDGHQTVLKDARGVTFPVTIR